MNSVAPYIANVLLYNTVQTRADISARLSKSTGAIPPFAGEDGDRITMYLACAILV